MVMATLRTCGDWFVASSGRWLIAIPIQSDREPFLYDCSKAESKPKDSQQKGDEGASEENGNDQIQAIAVSSSAKFCALTDDNKRLILFVTEPSWQCVSTRWVVRKCTSLAFTHAEDQLLAADKSGDVYSFSVSEPQKAGHLELGHLSMLLAMAITPDDRYVITADRDEKVRVSVLKTPHNIQAFCLGHREFVSALCVPAGHPHWLLSASGDGTLQLWEYESGRRLQKWDLKELMAAASSDSGTDTRLAVSRVASSPDGGHVAVLCDSVSTVHLFRTEAHTDSQLVPSEKLTLPHNAWDLTFDPKGRLWVLLESQVQPVVMYRCTQEHWECEDESLELKLVLELVLRHWDVFEGSVGAESRFKHLYKVNFDNMASYLQKKQDRIEQLEQHKGRKRTGKRPQSNGAGKRARETDTPTAESHPIA